LTAEAGIAGPFLALLALVSLAKGSRASPAVAGAVAAGGLYALIVGHLAAPLNGALMLLLVVHLLDRRAHASECMCPSSTAGQLLSIAGVVAAVACVALPAGRFEPTATQADSLWVTAKSAARADAYEEAGQAYLVRWEALHRARWAQPDSRVRDTARHYALFCLDYADYLESQDDGEAALGYRALADQLLAKAR
jgi:hypothetical protein